MRDQIRNQQPQLAIDLEVSEGRSPGDPLLRRKAVLYLPCCGVAPLERIGDPLYRKLLDERLAFLLLVQATPRAPRLLAQCGRARGSIRLIDLFRCSPFRKGPSDCRGELILPGRQSPMPLPVAAARRC
jgi:hypothetical protein